MLTHALLNLDSYYFTEVNVSLDMEHLVDADNHDLNSENLITEFVVHEDSESGDNLIVSLKVTSDDSDSKLAVKISVGVIGRFIFSAQLKDEISKNKSREALAVSNSLSILYNSIREQIYSITSKMPMGPLFLPTCIFNIEMRDENKPKSRSTTKSKKTSPKPA